MKERFFKKNLRVSFRTRHRSAGHGEAVSWGRSRGNQETINLRVFAHITSSHLFTLAISSAICWCCYNGIKVIRAGEMGFCCFSCNSACQSEMGVFWNFTPSLANIRCFCRMDHGFWAEFYWLVRKKKSKFEVIFVLTSKILEFLKSFLIPRWIY